MERELRILVLEDVPTDAELMERELRRGGFSFSARRVASRDSFVRELEAFEPDLVLADYALPSFDGMAALAIARERRPEVPFIFVSGAIGEEPAIETLRELERQHIIEALELTGGRVSGERGASEILGLKPTTLEARMKKLGITRKG